MMPFVVWMLGYPLMSTITAAIYFTMIRHHIFSRPYQASLLDVASWSVDLCVWAGVGRALWKKGEP